MSRHADIAVPVARHRRLSAVWLVIPLLLIGVWEFAAPRPHAVDHGRATPLFAAGAGVAGRD